MVERSKGLMNIKKDEVFVIVSFLAFLHHLDPYGLNSKFSTLTRRTSPIGGELLGRVVASLRSFSAIIMQLLRGTIASPSPDSSYTTVGLACDPRKSGEPRISYSKNYQHNTTLAGKWWIPWGLIDWSPDGVTPSTLDTPTQHMTWHFVEGN